jgi:mono/diheme cytochrome c family protein
MIILLSNYVARRPNLLVLTVVTGMACIGTLTACDGSSANRRHRDAEAGRSAAARAPASARRTPLYTTAASDGTREDTAGREEALGDNDADSASVVLQGGRDWFMQSCANCHGANGRGMPHQGPDLTASRFVANGTDDELVSFLKAGRPAGDPASVMGLFMPARGGNMGLGDTELTQIVTYLRSIQDEAGADQGRAEP